MLIMFEQYQVHANIWELVNRRNSIIVAVGQGTTPLSLGPWGRLHDLTTYCHARDRVGDLTLRRVETWTHPMVLL
jgi:hypothetical protein